MTHTFDRLSGGHCTRCSLSHEAVWRDERLLECRPNVIGLRQPSQRKRPLAYVQGDTIVVEKPDRSIVHLSPKEPV